MIIVFNTLKRILTESLNPPKLSANSKTFCQPRGQADPLFPGLSSCASLGAIPYAGLISKEVATISFWSRRCIIFTFNHQTSSVINISSSSEVQLCQPGGHPLSWLVHLLSVLWCPGQHSFWVSPSIIYKEVFPSYRMCACTPSILIMYIICITMWK